MPKPTIKSLKDSYEISRSILQPSTLEAQEAYNMFTNRQYTDSQLALLGKRGQPKETFNIVALFTRSIAGFLDKVANDIQVKPRTQQSENIAYVVNDGVQYITERNSFDSIKKKFQLDGMLSGLMVTYTDVVDTGKKDDYGRPIYDINIEHVPSWQMAIDPTAKKDDYSDAVDTHRFRWMSEEAITELFGKRKVDKLQAYYNFTDDDKAEFEKEYGERMVGKYKVHDYYLVMHTIAKRKGKTYSCQWADEVMLSCKEVTYKEVSNPYTITKMNDLTERVEFYGIFREVIESQKAINQALVQIQMLVNTSRAFVEKNAVEDLETFKEEFNRVNSVISVKYLNGIKVENMSQDVLSQYTIIDKAFERIQQVLGVNDSFLGQAYASDSGRKVQIQQNSSVGMLQYVTSKVQKHIALVGEDIVYLMKQYMTATQILRVGDKITGDRYVMMNQPMTMPNGQVDPTTGQPIEEVVMVEDIDPETGELVYDQFGNLVMVPLNDPDSGIEYSDVDIIVESVSHNNAEEKNQLLIENVVNGPAGQFLMQTNPAGYATMLGLSSKESGAKYGSAIGEIFMQTAKMISGGQIDPMLAMLQGNGAAMGGQLGGANGGNATAPQGQIPKVGREGGQS